MRHVPRMFRGVLLAALLLTGSPAPAAAQPAPADAGVLVVNTDATFMRAAPNVRAAVVVRLERGERVEVLERGEGEWWKVRAGDPPREGYVHRAVLGPYTVPATPPRAPYVPPSARQAPPPADTPAEAAAPVDTSPRPRGAGLLVTAGAGIFMPTARDSFDAVGITGNPFAFGGTVEGVRIYKSLFVRASLDYTSETGERVFFTGDGERVPLGIPLDVTMMPIEFAAGWRFEGRTPRPRAIVPYAGGGMGWLSYKETDEFAEADDEVDERFVSYHVLAGVDVYVHRVIGARVEYRFRSVPDALGDGGVSAVTGDTSLGGSVVYVGIVLGR